MSASSSSSSAATASVAMTVKQMRRSLPLVDRFLIRQSYLQSVAQAEGAHNVRSQRGHLINTNPTKRVQNAATGQWFKPRLSIRRQAQLGKAAYAEGRFDELIGAFKQMQLPIGQKLSSLQRRIRHADAAERRSARQLAAATHEPTEASVLANQRAMLHKKEADKQANRLARAFASTHGPYRGRSTQRLFKGTLAERQAPARKRLIVERLGKMDDTIASWRKTQKEAKVKAQPKLPF